MKHILRSSSGALLAAMIAAGCASKPPASEVAAAETAIGNATQVVDRAGANPAVTQYAGTELDRANASLDQARQAWSKHHDLKATTHLAYVAQQRAATAEHLANARAAEDTVKVAAVQRDKAVAMAAAERRGRPTRELMQEALSAFRSGSARLPSSANHAINELAVTLRNNPDQVVVIEGHTDNVGNPAYNQKLAMQRAEAVRMALIRRGIDSSRITLRSLGEDTPVASNDTTMGRSENRRAQVIIGDMEGTAIGSSQGGATSSGGGRQEPGKH
jgi:outer membrane protein OmpA-like peptidoglycan-associated protein